MWLNRIYLQNHCQQKTEVSHVNAGKCSAKATHHEQEYKQIEYKYGPVFAMDLLFSGPDLRHSGGRTVFIVGAVAHSLDTESVIESSILQPQSNSIKAESYSSSPA